MVEVNRAAVHAVTEGSGNDLLLHRAQGGKGRAAGRLGNRAPVDAVDVVAHHRAITDGGEEAAGHGVEIACGLFGVGDQIKCGLDHLVTLGRGNAQARGFGQLGKRHVVGHRHQHGIRRIKRQRAASEQGFEFIRFNQATRGGI